MANSSNSTVTFTASDQQQEILNQRWAEAGIGNDYIFSCIMRDADIFLRLMQRIFPELNLTRVEKHSPQATFLGPMGSKSVRFDVYSEVNGQIFDVEMQLESRGNEQKRTRYYQCMIDEQVLHQGEDYADLPPSYIVMISPKDLFGQGRYIYRFRNYEQTDRDLALGDGTTKVFLNTHGTDDSILPELKNFLKLINGDSPADDFCTEVNQRVQEAKQDAETRRNFMEFEYMQMLARKDAQAAGRKEGLEEGRKEGREIGLKEGREEGRQEGREEGREEGRQEGRQEGREEGRQEGREEERLHIYAALVRDGIISLDDAAKRSGLRKEQLQEEVGK